MPRAVSNSWLPPAGGITGEEADRPFIKIKIHIKKADKNPRQLAAAPAVTPPAYKYRENSGAQAQQAAAANVYRTPTLFFLMGQYITPPDKSCAYPAE